MMSRNFLNPYDQLLALAKNQDKDAQINRLNELESGLVSKLEDAEQMRSENQEPLDG
jgi:hypothetical protein